MTQSDDDWWDEMCKKHNTKNYWPTKAKEKKTAQKKAAKKSAKKKSK